MLALGVPHVNRLLHVAPESWTVAEELPDPVRHVGAHGSSFLANLVNSSASDTDKIRHLPLIEFPSLDLAPQQPTWMRRSPLPVSSHVSPSVLVIILQVYLVGVSRLESEGNPPVLRHGHAPFTLTVALQRVGAEQTAEAPLGVGTIVALENVESWTGRIRRADTGVSYESQLKRFRSGTGRAAR